MTILNMFEKEIQFITDFNINKLKTLGSGITYEKISNSEIHPSVIKYISADLDYRIYKDRQRLLEKSIFDYSGPGINEYFSRIAGEIKLNRKIPAEEIKKLIIQAVYFNANFLIAPRTTMSEFIFNENDTRNVSEIKMLLNYGYYYDYVTDIFFKFLTRQQAVSLSYNEYQLLYSRIDNELFSQYRHDLMDNVLDHIADFYNEGAVDKSRIPVSLVFPFLEEKKLTDYLSRLKKIYPDPQQAGIRRTDIDELKRIIFSPLPSENEQEKTGNEELTGISSEDSENHPDNFPDEEVPEIEPDVNEKRDVDFDLEEINLKTEKADPRKNEESEKVAEEKKRTEKEIRRNIPFTGKGSDSVRSFEPKRNIPEEHSAVKKPDKKDPIGFLSNKDIEKIISAIFNDDRDDFSATMEKISECSSYEEATEVLKAVFFSYKINPYSREAITFTNAVSNYFEQGQ